MDISKLKMFLRKNALTTCTMLGIILGVCLGIAMRSTNLSKINMKRFALPGDIFINILKLITVPIITCSIITGVAKLGRVSGMLGVKMLGFTVFVIVVSSTIGIILTVAIKPGRSFMNETLSENTILQGTSPVDSMLDLLRNFFPENIVAAAFETTHTVLKTVSNNDGNRTVETMEMTLERRRGINSTGLIAFSTTFGFMIGRMKKKGEILFDFFDGFNDAMMKLVNVVMWYAPVGIVFLISSSIMVVEDAGIVIGQVGLLVSTIIVGQIIFEFFLLPIFYVVLVRKNPYVFILNLSQTLLTALATASSYSALSLAMQASIKRNKLDEHVISFVLPIGSTINKTGTVLYVTTATIFIAQINNIDLSIGEYVVISITSSAACMASPGMPDGSPVSVMIALTSIGLADKSIALIMSINWLVDRFSTFSNVLGNCLTAGILAPTSSAEKLAEAENSDKCTSRVNVSLEC